MCEPLKFRAAVTPTNIWCPSHKRYTDLHCGIVLIISLLYVTHGKKMGDVSKYGRNYARGKALSEDMVSTIIDEIVDIGGDTATGFFEQYSAVATKFKLSPKTIKKVWMRFCKSGQLKPEKSCASGVKHLKREDLDFIELLKTDKPSMTSGDLLKEVKRYCVIPEGTSREAINRH